MPLEFQLAQANFRFGLAEGQDPRLVPFGTLTTAENARWTKGGRIEKRMGLSPALSRSIVGGGTISTARRLATSGNSLVLVDNDYVHTWSPSLGAWFRSSQLPQFASSWAPAVDTMQGVGHWDVASCASGAYEVLAWTIGAITDSADAISYVMVRDTSTGAVVIPVTLLPFSSRHIKVVGSGSVAYVVASETSSTAIKVATITPSTQTVSAATTLRADVSSAATSFDACMIGANLLVVYQRTGAAPDIAAYTYLPSTWVQQATGSVTGEASIVIKAISVDGDASDQIYVMYALDAAGLFNLRTATLHATTLAQVVAPANVEVGFSYFTGLAVKWVSSGIAILTWGVGMAAGFGGTVLAKSCMFQGGGPDSTTRRGTIGAQWISRPVNVDGRWLALQASGEMTAASSTSLPMLSGQSILVEVETGAKAAGDWQPHRHIGTVDTLISGQAGSRSVASGYQVSATEGAFFVPYQSSAVSSLSGPRQALRRVSVVPQRSAQDYARPLPYGLSTVLTCGVLTSFDGVSAFPLGFSSLSAVSFNSPVVAGGGSIGAGNYQYASLPEYRDANGILQRGIPGLSSILAVGAAGKVTFGFWGQATSHHEPQFTGLATSTSRKVTIAVYRTTAGGSIYYRLTSESAYTAPNNDPFGGAVAYVDTASDSVLSGQPVLYTVGGEVEDRQAPSPRTGVVHAGRIFVIDGGKRNVWFSKLYADNPGIAPSFYPTFTLGFDVDLTALASLDDKLVIFARNKIWFLQGQGPASNGLNSDYGPPVAVATDVGCTNPRSVVSTPDGVVFQSERGLFILTRGLEVVWVGRPVKDQVAAYPSITSAVLVPSASEVRFTANAANGSGGIVIAYNYVERQWSTARYTIGGGATYGAPIEDAIMWNGSWVACTSDGYVYVESTTSNLDAGNVWVPLTLETAWVSAPGPLAFQSVRTMQLEGVSNSDHNLTVSVAVDGETTYAQTVTFMAGTDPVEVGPLEQCEVTIGPRRKCQHIRFRISDASPGNGLAVGTGMGPSFDTIGIEVGVKKGFAVNPALRKG